jgi:hypothetical protein
MDFLNDKISDSQVVDDVWGNAADCGNDEREM